jgi:hypothetical protein
MAQQPKFIADHMLGRLARWLRLLGYDTLYSSKPLADAELKRLAAAEGRILLTRDKDLASASGVSGENSAVLGAAPRVVYVRAEYVYEQLRELLQRLKLEIGAEALQRCARCNGLLESVEKSAVCGFVPEGVYERQEEFWRCKVCGKYYWQGSHWLRIVETIEELKKLRSGDSRGKVKHEARNPPDS